MPANLPPQYMEVVKKYGETKIPQRKLVYLQELLTIVAKHKSAGKFTEYKRRGAGLSLYNITALAQIKMMDFEDIKIQTVGDASVDDFIEHLN